MTPEAPSTVASTYGSQLKLNTRGASPPTEAYVGANDLLQVSLWNALAGQVIVVTARILLPDGTLNLSQWQFTPSSDRSRNQFFQTLTECFILSLQVNGTLAATGNRTFARVVLVSGQGQVTLTQVLAEGYLSPQHFLSYPPGNVENGTDGQGALVSITGTAPGAGVEINETVPNHVLWRLVSFFFKINTSATVANRQPHIILDDGANVLLNSASISVQAASTTGQYNIGDDTFALTQTDGTVWLQFVNAPLLWPGFRLRTLTTNLQASDQYFAPQYLVQEWLFN